MGIRELAGALVDLVLPGGCAGCGDPAAPWCGRCTGRLGAPERLRLPGGPAVLAIGRYSGPLRTAVLRYKERGRRDLAGALTGLLAAQLDGVAGGPVTWLVPAPSRPAAARARGGDHVLRLCRGLAAGRHDVRVARALRLTRHARDSVGLDAAQRAENLRGRMLVRAGELPPPGARVLLVDDVVTTGATLRACRAALAGSGVRADVALVLCNASGRRGDHEIEEKSYPPIHGGGMSFGASPLVGETRRRALLSNRNASYLARHPH